MGHGKKNENVHLPSRAGKKKERVHPPSRATDPNVTPAGKFKISARNLPKTKLGGVIFVCDHETMKECLDKQLFGLPSAHFAYVRNVTPGLPLFLFNYADKKLHGIFNAVCPGQLNIDPYAWTVDGSVRTPFPAQVRVSVKTRCLPVAENQFKAVIRDNYHSHNHFWFELDHAQMQGLTSLFKPAFVHENLEPSGYKVAPAVGRELLPIVPDGVAKNTDRSSSNPFSVPEDYQVCPVNTYVENATESRAPTRAQGEDMPEEDVLDWEKLTEEDHIARLQLTSDGSAAGECEKSAEGGDIGADEGCLSENNFVDGHPSEKFNDPCTLLTAENLQGTHSGVECDIVVGELLPSESSSSVGQESQFEAVINKLRELKEPRMPEDSNISEHSHKNGMLVQELAEKAKVLEKKQTELEKENRLLKIVVDELIKKHSSSFMLPSSTSISAIDRPSIYLIGGKNGNKWLQSVDAYSPKSNRLVKLRDMPSTHSYGASSVLNGNIVVLGGGVEDDRSRWSQSVECYYPTTDEWTLLPSLIRAKGSLAAATVNGKVYAVGGESDKKYLSEAEMFDPHLGKWIPSQSMLQKRFALAAAELGGVLYAFGGFDGTSYLQTGERYDPREGFWSRCPDMNSRRGYHSMVVLGESLYALGGYDGTKMVSSVEIYDPRCESWIMGEPMNKARGYSSATVLNSTLYVIGGLASPEGLVDSVECYDRSGGGWTQLNSDAIGKRGFHSAVAL